MVNVTSLATDLARAAEAAGLNVWTVCVRETSPTVALITWFLYGKGNVELAAETTYPDGATAVGALTRAMLERLT